MIIGLLRETKTPADRRVPLTPNQCRLIEDEFPGIRIYVQPSEDRCFRDADYARAGIKLRKTCAIRYPDGREGVVGKSCWLKDLFLFHTQSSRNTINYY
jgi:alanine dehydrogenase